MPFLETEIRNQGFRKESDTLIRVWDGNWSLLGVVSGEFEHEFTFLNNDAGSATVHLPLDHEMSEMLMDPGKWPTKSVYITFDKDGARWSGRIQTLKVIEDYKGDQQVELYALHDYHKLRELLVWANPFLPAEIQFPKAWVLFGPARWAVTTTLFVNLLRKNNSLWMLPDDPLNFRQWFNLDMSNWSMAVKPVEFGKDSSLTSIVHSRFKSFHDCVAPILADAQLTIDCRRYLPGDPDPIPGKSLRHGCLVFDVKDQSGWNKQTSFFGNMSSGLERAVRRVSSDGMVDGLQKIPRVEFPEEYSRKVQAGSLPEAPWVVLNHGPYTGIETSEFEYTPPGPSQFVTGGSSMPGVNETIKAGIIGLGGFLGTFIGFQTQLGAVADALLEPLYSDVFMAFMAHKHHDRIREQGWDYPFEQWVDGSDQAYTLNALSTLRRAKHDTRERFAATAKMNNGSPYWVGPPGYGDFFIGDRVAVHALGMPEDQLYVDQVQELTYRSSGVEKDWEISVGKPEFTTGFEFMQNRLERLTTSMRELGVW